MNPPDHGYQATVCFLSSLHPPYDKRVFHKEAIALADAGLDVAHVAPSAVAGEAEHRGVRVVTFRSLGGGMRRWLSLPKLFRHALRMRPRAVHCNELDSWLVGVVVGILGRTKVVFDVHEIYSGEISERFPSQLRELIAALVRLYCRLLLPLTDRVVFAKKSAQHDFPKHGSKYVLARNFALLPPEEVVGKPAALSPSSGTLRATRPDNGTGAERDVIAAIHVGEISVRRGWPAMLEALRGTSAGARLEIIGHFEDDSFADFQNCVEELGLADRVSVSEWLPYEEMMNRLREASIGLIAFQPGVLNHTFALPHKLFDYMMAGLPVIAPGFAVEVAEIITESACGRLVDPSRPQEISDAFDDAAADPAAWRDMGQRGRTAARLRYNWPAEAEKLTRMYAELLPSSR